MYNADEFEKSVPPGIERSLEDLPYDVARKELYTARELFEAFDRIERYDDADGDDDRSAGQNSAG